jgi:hypothetical protein
MTHTGRVVGYSINYIRGDDISTYLALNPSAPGPPARLNEYPLVVPFIIQGEQAAVNPTPPNPVPTPCASQIYKAAGNLFQPYTLPQAEPYFGSAFGGHEWFKEEYQKHMEFKPGDLLTVGALKWHDGSRIDQNCQVTVYIEHFDA